jgi:hypothetical protein
MDHLPKITLDVLSISKSNTIGTFLHMRCAVQLLSHDRIILKGPEALQGPLASLEMGLICIPHTTSHSMSE